MQLRLVSRVSVSKVLLVVSVILCVMTMQNINSGVSHVYWWSAIGLACLGGVLGWPLGQVRRYVICAITAIAVPAVLMI